MRKRIFNLTFVKIIILFFCFFLAKKIVFDFEGIFNAIKGTIHYIMEILSYFIWGFAIAYVLNPMVNYFSDKFKFLNKFKYKKGLIVLFVYLLAIGFLAIIIISILPVVINSIRDIATNFDTYLSNFENAYNNLMEKFNIEGSEGLVKDFGNLLERGFKMLTDENSLKWLGAAVSSTTTTILRVIFGFVLSVYMLVSKDQMIESSKNIVYGLLPKKADQIIDWGRRVNRIFSKYIVGKIIDSILNGVLAFIGLSIIGAPYKLLISLIIGVTNMVPYFGAFFGGFLAALIVLLSQPNIMLVFWTIVIDIIIQQLDSWLIAPKILENQMGISPILIIAGITVGGSLFGFMGMVLGVPLVAVLKEIFYDGYIMKRVKAQKKLNDKA